MEEVAGLCVSSISAFLRVASGTARAQLRILSA
jgi:hypothetical protein